VPSIQVSDQSDLMAAIDVVLKNILPATEFLRGLSHVGRLQILCHLAKGEQSVSDLEGLLGERQAAVSQQLARLRLDGFVTTRRAGKSVFYSLSNDHTTRIIGALGGIL
jgi:DNA-binding transcriptional ArsR family regulator